VFSSLTPPRGKIVNIEDLIDALQHGNVHAAGLILWKRKKILKPHRQNIEDEIYTILRALPNVLITGHQDF
jgi:D-lactate dehydrogenase